MFSDPYLPPDLVQWITAQQEQIERERGENTPGEHRGPTAAVGAGSVGESSGPATGGTAAHREPVPDRRAGGLGGGGQEELPRPGEERPRQLPAADRRGRTRHKGRR